MTTEYTFNDGIRHDYVANVKDKNMTNEFTAKLTVLRVKEWIGAVNLYRVYLDNVEIGRIANGQEVTFQIKPGRHNFHVNDTFNLPLTGKVPFEVGEGEHYAFAVYYQGGLNPLRSFAAEGMKLC
ncbi:MAG: hypothetical protein IJY15_01480 [Thermoguttaceae bacterium]|nr:hypothetical protein [Thermoguttaceae bacterium]MBQ9126411.1 hypothetical protein [Thermoguttaceae bacterium]